MQLRFLKSLRNASESTQEGELPVKISALAWSANGMRLAAATSDRQVLVFDEQGEQRDKFSLKPCAKDGARDFLVRAIEFSLDSSKLAIAQSDNVVYVYGLGLNWDDRKSICNKFVLKSPPTTLAWPSQRLDEIVFGTAEGKLKVGILRNNKSANLFDADSYVVSTAAGPDGHSFVSSHMDGAIYRYTFPDPSGQMAATKSLVVRLAFVPYCLAWGAGIVAAGNASKVIFLSAQGDITQQFTFDPASDGIKEFTCASFNATGKTVVLGNFNQFVLFSVNDRDLWVQSKSPKLANVYTITGAKWKGDGSRLVTGTLGGAIDMFDSCLRREMYKSLFEITYTSPCSVIIRHMKNGIRMTLLSQQRQEILQVDVFDEKFVVCRTRETLLIGDMVSGKSSEIRLAVATGKPKYIWQSPDICVVFNNGELSVAAIGTEKLLGCCRTDYFSNHLISLRIDDGSTSPGQSFLRRIAYLIDLQTIGIMDLSTSASIAIINHDTKIDWLEMNPRGSKILFRDKRRLLHMFDITTQDRTTLISFCNYAQWIPHSDVVVAQNRTNLFVWYNTEDIGQVTSMPITGDVIQIERGDGRTNVVVDESGTRTLIPLDETLISFGVAIESGQYESVVQALERLEENSNEADSMWTRLSKLALQNKNFIVAERCYIALGDLSKARFIHDLIKRNNGIDDMNGRIALFNGNFREAESVFLDNGNLEEAIEMYVRMHKWDEAIALGEARGYSGTNALRQRYFSKLMNTGQEVKAAELREKEGDHLEAIHLYIKGGYPARAASLVLNHNLIHDSVLTEEIGTALLANLSFEKAGEFFDRLNMQEKALKAYLDGRVYSKGIELGRRCFPERVVSIECEWGDWLASQAQWDAACNHFIEAGQYVKAINAAIEARQYSKAGQILSNVSVDVAQPFYKRIGDHFAETGKYREAEANYLRGEFGLCAVKMYLGMGNLDDAARVAGSCLNIADRENIFLAEATAHQAKGDLHLAEKIFLIGLSNPGLAINMYSAAGNNEAVIRLVTRYRSDALVGVHTGMAQKAIEARRWKIAESHLVRSNQWKLAVDMYREQQLWEEAMRVAREHGGISAFEIVACSYSRSMVDPEQSVQFLIANGIANRAIEIALERSEFTEAFRIAERASTSKLPEVHLHYAMSLEDEGAFENAEIQFIKANKPREAVDMYLHQREWSRAMTIAQASHDLDAINSVYVAQGTVAEEEQKFAAAESLFVQGSRPDLAIKMFRAAGAWNDALRLAKQFSPNLVTEITSQAAMIHPSLIQPLARKQESYLLGQAQSLYNQGQFSAAIEAYLRITIDSRDSEMTDDILEKAWTEAVNIAMAHASSRVNEIVGIVAQRLVSIRRPIQAAEMYAGVELYKEAIQTYIQAGELSLAKELASRSAPLLLPLIEMASNKSSSSIKSGSNAPSSLDVDQLADAGEWSLVFERLEGNDKSVNDRYTLMNARQLMESNSWMEAVHLLAIRPLTPIKEYSDTVRRIVEHVLSFGFSEKSYDWAECRFVSQPFEGLYPTVSNPFRELLLITHLLALYRLTEQLGIKRLNAKVAISLLRYIKVIPMDCAFYEAGRTCRDVEWTNMAFVFFNRFVDICDLIEDPSHNNIDDTDFHETDIPPVSAVTLIPKQMSYSEEDREEIREWVLETAMGNTTSQSLTQRTCEKCARRTYVASLSCHSCHCVLEPCLVTGYPVLDSSRVQCPSCLKQANRDDWNRIVTKIKQCAWCHAPASPFV